MGRGLVESGGDAALRFRHRPARCTLIPALAAAVSCVLPSTFLPQSSVRTESPSETSTNYVYHSACCSRRRPTSRRYTGRNLPRLRHSSTRPAMLHASETAQLECRMGRGLVESGGDAAPHRPARCGHRLSHRDGHRAFDAARDGHSICAQANWRQPCRKGQEGRRKVLRWSREPWRDADDLATQRSRPGDLCPA